MTPPCHDRADTLLTRLGLVDSRSRARDLIRRGLVYLADGTPVDKPSRLLPPDTRMHLAEAPLVSRAGEKLAAFLDASGLGIEPGAILDIGASTGGFTDCLLRRGATRATCVDVGHGQLHPRIAADTRVVSLEGVNARYLEKIALEPPQYSCVVVDVSFIPLSMVWSAAWSRVLPNGMLISLIKPQFEADPDLMRRHEGVLRDERQRADIIRRVLATTGHATADAHLLASMDAAIAGADGNIEAFAAWRKLSR